MALSRNSATATNDLDLDLDLDTSRINVDTLGHTATPSRAATSASSELRAELQLL